MDAYTTNSSYWRSSGLAYQQWVMYSYNTHTSTHLKCGFKFRTDSVLNDRIFFSKDGPINREWLFIQYDQKLHFSLYKTNATYQLIPLADAGYHTDGKWHEVEIEWNSNGAGLGGVLTATIDGVITNYDTPTIDYIRLSTNNVTLNGRDNGYGPIGFDCEYVTIGERKWTFSSLYSTIVYSNDGEKYFQSVNQTLANVWKLSTDSYVKPYNFINGGYRYTNGNPAQDVILTKELEKIRYDSGGKISGFATNEVNSWSLTMKSEFFGISKNIDFRFLVSTNSPFSGYRVYISQVSNVHGILSLARLDSGVETLLASNIVYLFTMGEDVTINITRSNEGLIEVLNGSTSLVTITDTTYNTSVASQIYNQRHYVVSCFAGSTPFALSGYALSYLGLPDYTSHTVIPPLSFNNVETAFYLPFNQKVEDRDTTNKIYDHETDTPNKVYYSDLVNDGFGDKIEYRDNENDSFSNFKVKR